MSLVGHQRPALIRAQVHVVSVNRSSRVAVNVMFECCRADNVASSTPSSPTSTHHYRSLNLPGGWTIFVLTI